MEAARAEQKTWGMFESEKCFFFLNGNGWVEVKGKDKEYEMDVETEINFEFWAVKLFPSLLSSS